MPLTTVRIERFKSLKALELDLDTVTCLVGPNNSGKSSVLQGIQFGISVAQTLRLAVGVRRSGTLAADELVYAPLRDIQTLAHGGRLRQNTSQQIAISFEDTDGYNATVEVRRGKNSNISVSLRGDQELIDQLQSIDSPYSVLSPGLAGIPAYEEYKSPALVRRAAARGDANAVLRNVLWILSQDAVEWEKFTARLGSIFPDVHLDVRFDPNRDEHIAVDAARKGLRLPLDASGTGVLQAAQILAYVGTYKPRLLILDEPDSHLHPDNQRGLVRLLDNIAPEVGFQVLLSTHSRHLLDECSRLDCRVTWLSSGGAVQSNVQTVDALLDLGALDVGDRLRAGKITVLVLTEDEKTKAIQTILEANNFDLERVQVWSYVGCSNIRTAHTLARFVADHSPGTRVVLHRDRDYLSESSVSKLREQLGQRGIDLWITPGVDLESAFLVPDHLSAVLHIEREEAIEILDKATVAARQESLEKLLNARANEAVADARSDGMDVSRVGFGRAATAAEAEYDGNPTRYRHGKTVLKRVRAMVNDRGLRPDLITRTSSRYLIDPALQRVWSEVEASASA